MHNLSCVIEVYRLQDTPGHSYLFREIPIGTTFSAFDRQPDFIWKYRLRYKFRSALVLDHPVSSYVMTFPPSHINSTVL